MKNSFIFVLTVIFLTVSTKTFAHRTERITDLLLDSKRNAEVQEEERDGDNTHLWYITHTLHNIEYKLNDMQKPCSGETSSKKNEQMDQVEESIRKLANKLNNMEESITNMQQKYHELRLKVNENQEITVEKTRELKQSYEGLKESVNRNIGGTTYIRWGRTTCPGNGSETVYSGYAGGSHYNHQGAASTMLCLPQDPDWLMQSEISVGERGLVYGAEYESSGGRIATFFGNDFVNHDVPCVVCQIKSRSSYIMIPAKIRCHPGWTLEYTGYLMSGYFDHPAATDYICMDKDPEMLPGGSENKDGRLLHFVESVCGSLRCPPYKNLWELSCAVCSK